MRPYTSGDDNPIEGGLRKKRRDVRVMNGGGGSGVGNGGLARLVVVDECGEGSTRGGGGDDGRGPTS